MTRGAGAGTPVLPPSAAIAAHTAIDPAVLGYALVFLSVFVPTTYQPLKGLLLAVCLAQIGWSVLARGTVMLHPGVGALSLGYAAIGLAWVWRGLATEAPGATSMAGVVVLWPLVFTLLASGASSRTVLRRLLTTLVVALFAIEAYSLWFLAREVGWLPPALFIEIDQGLASSVREGFVEYNLYSIASLLHLIPFVITALVMWPDDGTAPASRRWLWITLALGLVTAVLSGRRALLLVVALAVPMALLAWLVLDPRARRDSWPLVRGLLAKGAGLCGAAAVFLAWGYGLTPSRIYATFAEGFAFRVDPIAMMRARQLQALLDSWWQAPVIGQGLGAVAPGMIRDYQMPWAYELSYATLLMNVGIVGFVLYSLGFVWMGIMAIRIARTDAELGRWLLPAVVGMAAFLVGNATNPYLMKFDAMWVVFLPVTFINAWLVGLGPPPTHTASA